MLPGDFSYLGFTVSVTFYRPTHEGAQATASWNSADTIGTVKKTRLDRNF